MAKKKRRDSGHKHKLVGLRLPEALREEAQAMADAEERPLAQMCAILVREALQARREKGK
jgi:hypothetical protein